MYSKQKVRWLYFIYIDLEYTSLIINALFKEQGSVDHHIDIILYLAQGMVVIVQVHLHSLTPRLML